MSMRAVLRTIGIGLAMLVSVTGIRNAIRVRTIEREFPSVKVGDSIAAVQRRLGDPGRVEQCGFLASTPPGCAHEYIYTHPYAPVVPESWVVWVSRGGSVLAADRLTSP